MVTDQINSTSQASEQRYRHLFEILPICIFIVDLTATPLAILQLNKRTELVFGYTAAELVGKSPTLLAPEESGEEIRNILQHVQQGERVTNETTGWRRDGTSFPMRVIAILDPTDKGHMIVTAEDITIEKERRSEAEAIEAERLRIAHEIHDSVAQSLAGLRFKTALWSHLADSIEGAPPAMRNTMHEALDEMQTVLATAIEDIRRAIFALRPLDLEAQGFLPALNQLVTNFGDHNLLSARLVGPEPQNALPASYELPLYRIIQEGLNNINQHACADSVLVSLSVDEAGGVALSLCDNGCGFDPGLLRTGDPPGHFGLRQMRERILELGGTLDIHSSISEGTELLITLPPLEAKDAPG
jgi:PAS domain S-box-containing protein